jgi:hypothetical protein
MKSQNSIPVSLTCRAATGSRILDKIGTFEDNANFTNSAELISIGRGLIFAGGSKFAYAHRKAKSSLRTRIEARLDILVTAADSRPTEELRRTKCTRCFE